MNVSFDVYTKKTRLFYISEGITIITLIVIAAGCTFNIQFKTPLMPLIDALLIIGSFTTVAFLVIVSTGLVRTYIKDGELILGEETVVIDGTKIPLNDASNIKLRVGVWNRKRAGNLLGNRVEITDKNNKTYKNRFAIKSYDHNQEFEKVVTQWQTNGVKFDLSYFIFN
ncbi:hypothetical protein KXD93_16415 [Mucilaginibacter sp. BJC16-A38]|uniref:hypothetical protein n=1 Tax=Mucilaginibacter phenanthrenivorans TaxID=1234842 RepID=UPI0021582C29|nr:hypothetical protein [Mucilaginibacter phenanthrenivorans]MCR8559243.1 hypothetical protein [Mucilaginibacter phenanthrenivorans]